MDTRSDRPIPDCRWCIPGRDTQHGSDRSRTAESLAGLPPPPRRFRVGRDSLQRFHLRFHRDEVDCLLHSHYAHCPDEPHQELDAWLFVRARNRPELSLSREATLEAPDGDIDLARSLINSSSRAMRLK